MSYTVAALVGVAAAIGLDLLVLRTRMLVRRAFWAAEAIIVLFQLLSNGILTGRGIVQYDERATTGLRVVNAPAEDLLFGFALSLSTLALWVFAARWDQVSAPPRRPSPPP